MNFYNKIIILSGFISHLSFAQSTLNINVGATVLAPITYTETQNLNFGEVLPNITKTISITDASHSGLFTLNGEGNKEVQISMNKPTELVGPESATMPINFTTGDGVIATSSTSNGTKTTQSGSATLNLTSGRLFFFIGGSVSPSSNQIPGAYSGTITFNSVYTGN